MEDLFEKAVEFIKNPDSGDGYTPDNMQKLKFYALYKQATEGKCTGKAPSRLKVVERAKYDAWKELGSMTKEEARKTYVQELTKTWPQWTTPKPKL